MRRTFFRSLSLVATLVGGCAPRPNPEGGRDASVFDVEATRTVIAQQNKHFCSAHVAGDVAAIDALFLPDARSYPPGAAAAIGIQAIHDLTVDFLKSGITACREETTVFYGNAEFVVDEGTYVLTYGGVTERGKYINVWKQVDRSWRIQANIWNAAPSDSTSMAPLRAGAIRAVQRFVPPTAEAPPAFVLQAVWRGKPTSASLTAPSHVITL